MARKVAVITGANKGLGYALVRALCPVFEGDVILTARDEGRGKAAIQKLEEEGLRPKFHQLDVTDHSSVLHLKDFIQSAYGGLDILVNNAGVFYLPGSTVPLSEQATNTLDINYFGLMDVSNALFPLLKPHARVCNMSSRMGIWSYHRCSDSIKKRLSNPSISKDDLSSIMQVFVQSAQEDKTSDQGFPAEPYGVSKAALIVLSRLQQRELDEQGRNSILVNACTPGYVNTDLTAGKGTLTVEEGIVTPLYLCLLPASDESPRGLMLADKEIMDWENPSHAR